ncbi:MAG: DUF4203 domain-containing protein [Gammaproteobacteria bacterium]
MLDSEELPLILLAGASGLIMLFFGRRFFWRYIGLLGVLVGLQLAAEFIPGQPRGVAFAAAIGLGVLMALLAIALQYVAVALAGFVGGIYAGYQLLNIFPAIDTTSIPEILFLIPGVIGALFCLLLFNPGLIVLSSLTGAAILTQLFPLEALVQTLLFFVLASIGIVFQATMYVRRGDN